MNFIKLLDKMENYEKTDFQTVFKAQQFKQQILKVLAMLDTSSDMTLLNVSMAACNYCTASRTELPRR